MSHTSRCRASSPLPARYGGCLVCEQSCLRVHPFASSIAFRPGHPPFVVCCLPLPLQVLSSLAFLHSLGLVHADLKPENILVKSYSQCCVKVIDLGSSCFITDHLSSYVQVRFGRSCPRATTCAD